MISIVTAYYNRKELFIRTLKSIQENSEGIEYEVIAVDDGSDPHERLEDLTTLFPFLKIIRLEKEDKWYYNSCIPFNKGFAEAKGSIILLQNPECIHFGPILRYVKENLKLNKYFSFGCFSLDKYYTDNVLDKSDSKYLVEKLIIDTPKTVSNDGDNGWYNHPIYRPVGYHFCAAIHKEDLLDLGGFDERFALGIAYDDNEFFYRINLKGMKIKLIDNLIVLHQNHYNKNVVISEESLKLKNERMLRNRLIYENVTKSVYGWKVNCIQQQFYNCEKKTTNSIKYKILNLLYKKINHIHV